MKSTIFLVFLVITYLDKFTYGARILGIFAMPSYSHYSLGTALMRPLAEKGHDVTMISPYGEKDIPMEWKYRDIVLTEFAQQIEAQKKELFKRAGVNAFTSLFSFNYKGVQRTESMLNHTAVQKLLKSDEKFDVVILEHFGNDAFRAFAHHFKAHLILFSGAGDLSSINSLVGNPYLPAYMPHFRLGYPANMSLWQRLVNTVLYNFEQITNYLFIMPMQKQLVHKYVPNPPDLDIVGRNISLVLLNSHASVKQPVSLTPNMIEIGGYHIKPPQKLPENLQQFLDDAKAGVIYFSMGSNLKSRDIPVKKREAILKVFSKLKQEVLWKWEEDILPDQPKNVKLSKWLPQQSILAHPNVKAFITHGGLLSTLETIYHGVPILALPIFGDQDANAETAVNYGYGVKVSFTDLTEHLFEEALNEILNNPRYRENAQKRSRLMHDRPMKPLDAAIYWIEYVIRNNGAGHFRSAALDLAWCQYLLLDVAAVVSIATVILVLAVKSVTKLVCGKKIPNKEKLH